MGSIEGPYYLLPLTSTIGAGGISPFILLLSHLHLVELEQRMQERFKRWCIGRRELATSGRTSPTELVLPVGLLRWYLRWSSPLLPRGRRE